MSFSHHHIVVAFYIIVIRIYSKVLGFEVSIKPATSKNFGKRFNCNALLSGTFKLKIIVKFNYVSERVSGKFLGVQSCLTLSSCHKTENPWLLPLLKTKNK